MRQLFLPACLFLITWSSATSSGSGIKLDDYFERSLVTRRQSQTEPPVMRLASIDPTASVIVAIPRDPEPRPVDIPASVTPSADDIGALVPDLSAEFPVPSGVVINNGEPIGIPLPPVPKPVVERSEDEVCNALAAAAQSNDVPAPFFIRLLFQESRFQPGAVSPVGAQGIAQFMPQTASQMGLSNPFDPVQAIPASARLLRDLVRQFGNLGLAAAAYNAGPKRIADWLAANGKAKLPEETQGYVKTITGRPVEHWSTASARHPAPKVPQRAPCQHTAGLLAYNGPDNLPLPQPSPLRASIKVAAIAKTDKGEADKTPQKNGRLALVTRKGPAKVSKGDPKKEPPKREKIALR